MFVIVVFDLDYTLLQTERLKTILAGSLGISEDQFQSDSTRLFKQRGRHYSLRTHAMECRVDSWERFRDQVSAEIDKRRSLLLFEESLPLLAACREAGATVELMTRGDREFQEFKVRALGLEGLFDRVCYVEGLKAEAVGRYRSKESEVVFINDNAKELQGTLDALPGARGILVSGPYSDSAKGGGTVSVPRAEILAEFERASGK